MRGGTRAGGGVCEQVGADGRAQPGANGKGEGESKDEGEDEGMEGKARARTGRARTGGASGRCSRVHDDKVRGRATRQALACKNEWERDNARS